ncbi:hypothetical protein GIB67_005641 [Kingdonia uniflora]|uniref:Uncharacterized protein n=1 Tax=Kingdonia uniflora TaxID=39325 RepID=A0A7J7NHU9_9MAGN|nr:hypothetical protein GIB67_005641 [Kingdonia uniflora]
MALKIARKGVSSTKCMEFTKGCLARVQEEVNDFLKANPEEVIDLEGDENLSTTKVGEVTNQDLAGANIMLRDEPRKKRNVKVGRIKGALEKGRGKKDLPNAKCNQESVRATTSATKRSLNSKVTTSLYTHEQHVDENVEPVMSHVQPNVYNEPMFNGSLEHPSQFYINTPQPQVRPFSLSEVLTVLEWASKQGVMMQDELVGSVLPETKNRLELYQS